MFEKEILRIKFPFICPKKKKEMPFTILLYFNDKTTQTIILIKKKNRSSFLSQFSCSNDKISLTIVTNEEMKRDFVPNQKIHYRGIILNETSRDTGLYRNKKIGQDEWDNIATMQLLLFSLCSEVSNFLFSTCFLFFFLKRNIHGCQWIYDILSMGG